MTDPQEAVDHYADKAKEQAAQELIARIQQYSDSFDHLTQERHLKGIEEYGQLTFLANDVVRMMMEELADTANYCRMQFIKLMFLQEHLETQLPTMGFDADQQGDLQIGWQKKKGTKDVGWSE